MPENQLVVADESSEPEDAPLTEARLRNAAANMLKHYAAAPRHRLTPVPRHRPHPCSAFRAGAGQRGKDCSYEHAKVFEVEFEELSQVRQSTVSAYNEKGQSKGNGKRYDR